MLPTLQPLPDASALGAIVLAVPGVASERRPAATAECRIALGGAPVEGWTLAVRELERSGSVPADCAVVAIEASGERGGAVSRCTDSEGAHDFDPRRFWPAPPVLDRTPNIIRSALGSLSHVRTTSPPCSPATRRRHVDWLPG